MVQVLPAVPGFGEKLIDTLSKAGSDVAKGLQRRGAVSRLQALGIGGTPAAEATISDKVNGAAAEGQPGGRAPLTVDNIVNSYNDIVTAYGEKAAPAIVGALTSQIKETNKDMREEKKLGYGGVKEYFENTEADRLKLPQEQMAADMILDAVKSGGIDPFSSPHLGEIARAFGVPESLTTILENPDSKEFKTARKTFIGNTIKDAFRGTTTKTEINLAEDMLAQVGVSKAGNLASSWGIQASIDIRRERLRLTDELKERGVPPSKIPATVDKMLQPYIKQTKTEYFDALKTLKE